MKGVLEEILSKAKYSDDPSSYMVTYRDFDKLVELSLDEFLKVSNDFQIIPASRIQAIKKKNKILFQKSSE
jgi:hypothetical protein